MELPPDRPRVVESEIQRTPTTELPLHQAVQLQMRPRELLLEKGPASLNDEQLLAILLRSGTAKCNVLELAKLLLDHYGSLRELIKAQPEELVDLHLPGLSRIKAIELSATFEIARRILRPNTDSPFFSFTNPEHVAEFLRNEVTQLDCENFFVLPLDRKNKLIGERAIHISKGILDATLVHPREVFRACVRLSACSVIVAHNHPSGDPTPSAEDIRITRKIAESGKVVGIPLLDHIVLGNPASTPSYISLRAQGIVPDP